jgi:hypothetical protein
MCDKGLILLKQTLERKYREQRNANEIQDNIFIGLKAFETFTQSSNSAYRLFPIFNRTKKCVRARHIVHRSVVRNVDLKLLKHDKIYPLEIEVQFHP